MKWFQNDVDFLNNPAIRRIFGRYRHEGIYVVQYIWGKVTERLSKKDPSCRLYEDIDLIALDTMVGPDRVAGIIELGCTLVYEVIAGHEYPIFDRDTKAPHLLGSSLMFYKADNNTRNSPWWIELKEERNRWESDRPLLDSSKTLASQTDITNRKDQQTNLPGLSAIQGGAGEATQFHDLYLQHTKAQHGGKHLEGCWTCKNLRNLKPGAQEAAG